MMPNISIVVPVYNIPETLLRGCLDSIINQTMRDIEAIIVDDGSTNGSEIICDEYAQKSSSMKVIHTKNAGVSNARNVGIECATADYVIFVDADDILLPDACEKIHGAAIKANVDILFFKPTDAFFIEEKDKNYINDMQVRIISHTDTVNGFVYGSPWCKVFRREFLDKKELRFTLGVKRSQDRLFMLYCLDATNKIAFFDYSGYKYVRNEESICNKYNENIVDILNNAENHIAKFILCYHQEDKTYLRALDILKIRFILTEMQLFFLNKKRGLSVQRRADELAQIFSASDVRRSIENIDIKVFSGKQKVQMFFLKRKMYMLTVIVFDLMNILTNMRNRVVHR